MRAPFCTTLRHTAGGLAFALCTTLSPAQAEISSVAVDIGPARVSFQQFAGDKTASLRVSCDDGTYIESAGMGTGALAFDPSEAGVMDAQCKYEIRVDALADPAAVQAAEAAGDEQALRDLWQAAQEQSEVENGSFQVVGGLITQDLDSATELAP